MSSKDLPTVTTSTPSIKLTLKMVSLILSISWKLILEVKKEKPQIFSNNSMNYISRMFRDRKIVGKKLTTTSF